MPYLSRRRFLRAAASGAAGLSLGAGGFRGRMAVAQSRNGGAALPGGFHLLTAGGCNALAVEAGDGIALVDGAPPDRAAELMERLADALPKAGGVHTLFNTHWHPEQTGANEPLADAGAVVVAHANTRLWMTTPVTWPWSGETVEPLPASALPSKTFFSEEELMIGDNRILCGHLRDCPHTDGDIYVYFEEDGVMAVGGAVSGAGWPSIDWWTGGWIGGIVGALDMILSVGNEDTRFVPSHGPVLSRSDLVGQYEMYNVIWERLLRILYGGGGPKEAHEAEPTKEFNDTMGDPETFVQRAFESLWPYLSPDA